ncbi:MAG: LamB/YcsF family protein [Planctomycetes bacterium]|nr:LamB/YcsF family protein [Planctomycetota bacterium]
MKSIDLNADVGEGFDDAPLLPFVSSVNIACGAHAGDDATMRRTIDLALPHRIAIGAHPGWDDPEQFGRRELAMPLLELRSSVRAQIERLAAHVARAGGALHHVKPHGALYNQASIDARLARAIVDGVRDVDARLVLVGRSGSALLTVGATAGLRVASEVFADRQLEDDGTLTPRSIPGACIDDPHFAAARVLRMVETGTVASRTGAIVSVRADSVCLHGDRPDAAAFARHVKAALEAGGLRIAIAEGA